MSISTAAFPPLELILASDCWSILLTNQTFSSCTHIRFSSTSHSLQTSIQDAAVLPRLGHHGRHRRGQPHAHHREARHHLVRLLWLPRHRRLHRLPQQLGCRPGHLRFSVHHLQLPELRLRLLVYLLDLGWRSGPGQVLLQRCSGEGQQAALCHQVHPLQVDLEVSVLFEAFPNVALLT